MEPPVGRLGIVGGLFLIVVGIGLLLGWARIGDSATNSHVDVLCSTLNCPEAEIEPPRSRYAPEFAILGLFVLALGAGIVVHQQAAIRAETTS